jgi:hypothetical protein
VNEHGHGVPHHARRDLDVVDPNLVTPYAIREDHSSNRHESQGARRDSATSKQRDVASSVWDLSPSEHGSCRAARWGFILLNRSGRKLGRRFVWLYWGGGGWRHLLRLNGGCRGLRLIRLNPRRLDRLNSGIGRRGFLIRLDGRGRRLCVIQLNCRRLVWLN